MLLPRELDPVEAGRDMPLPPERPGMFSGLSLSTMVDPTAVDPAAEETPAEAKPAAALTAAPKLNAKKRRQK